MLVSVTQEHIDKGQRGNCRSCPIALALMDALGQEYRVNAGMLCIVVQRFSPYGEIGEPRSVFTPSMVRHFMTQFDRHCPVKPFTFEYEEKH